MINVPTLKDRKEDIPLLVDKFLNDIAESYGIMPKAIDNAAISLLQNGNWSGNIRELRNVLERLVIMSDKTITEVHVKKYADI